MSVPSPGSISPLSPSGTPGPAAATGSEPSQPYKNYMDPANIWLNFFQQIMPGQQISAKEVKMFQLGVMKTMGQIIAHENQRWKEALKRMRDAEEGNAQ